jgi:hypothetical protein
LHVMKADRAGTLVQLSERLKTTCKLVGNE